jgi:hypothetical protein
MPKPIGDAIEAESDPKKQQQIKVDSMLEFALPFVGRTLRQGDYNYTLDTMVGGVTGDGIPTIVASITIRERKGGGVEVTPPDLNPVTIVNPPMWVLDPNGDINIGTEEEPVMAREDPAASWLIIANDLIAGLGLP